MRRRISLYIADNLVDLDKDSLVLFNYTMEDLTNPTIVKNSYSQQITLKGTMNNNLLFGSIFRLDRVIGDQGGNINADYNPSQKTPFAIYNEVGEILESGYCKLDTITRKGQDIEYKVSLYGGLGSFIYSLAYDADGNKRTLADIDYLGTTMPESELDFEITADNVRAAWEALYEGTQQNTRWGIVNFAPAYNGVPEGNFSPDTALVVPSSIGLQDEVIGDDGLYTLRSGYAKVNLAQGYDEWKVKDLRSYLQRPVLSMRAFLDAIRKPENNGGYVVNMPFLDKSAYGGINALWLTLPMIPSLGTSKQASGDLTLTLSSPMSQSRSIGRYEIGGTVPFGTKISTSVNVGLQYSIPDVPLSTAKLDTYAYLKTPFNLEGKETVIFMQLIAYASDGTVVGGSKVKAICHDTELKSSVRGLAGTCSYTPIFSMGDDTYERTPVYDTFNRVGQIFKFGKELGFSVEAQDVTEYVLDIRAYSVHFRKNTKTDQIHLVSVTSPNYGAPLYREGAFFIEEGYTPAAGRVVNGALANIITYTSAESLRTGAVITKDMLLSTSGTPADYLLSLCKIYGLHIYFDKATNEVTIMDRNDLYLDEVIDLTQRVDVSKGIDITPFVFDAKWYDFKTEGVGGAFYDEYKATYGKEYGIQRVNTGYDFNAESKDLLQGIVFRNAATILDRSKYYTMIHEGGAFKPSVFLDNGNKYTLWRYDGATMDIDIPIPSDSAVIEFYNEYGHPGYDIEMARKVEFRSKDNKPVDGANVLVFLEGWNHYDYFNLSDDVPAMDILNDGVPCWLLNPGSSEGQLVPIFQRYRYGSEWTIEESLDFGVPVEVNIPQITYKESATIYSKFWKEYIRDRYDVNTKVMRCRVDLGGLHVGNDLLRKFYWYGNALWVLNKIKNYSLTTYDSVECEFVQVQDKNNYLNGQS